jgi:hypothetical protein
MYLPTYLPTYNHLNTLINVTTQVGSSGLELITCIQAHSICQGSRFTLSLRTIIVVTYLHNLNKPFTDENL